MGTRFLISTETGVHHDWKRRVDAEALDAVKVVNDDPIMPPYTRGGVRSQARALSTPLISARASTRTPWTRPSPDQS